MLLVACGGSPAEPTSPDDEQANGAGPTSDSQPAASPPADEPGTIDGSMGSGSAQKACSDQCAGLVKNGWERLKRADGLSESDKAKELYAKAGEALEKAWRGCLLIEPALEDGGCEKASHIPGELARAYGAAGETEKAMTGHLAVLDKRWASTSEHESASKAELEKVAGDAKAPLAAQVYAQLALGQDDKVVATARKLRRDDSEARLAAGLYFLRKGDAAAAGKIVTPGSKPKEAGQQVVWNALRARIAMGQNNAAVARRSAEAALKLFDGASDKAALVGGQAPNPLIGRSKVMGAVGSAHFVLGEALGLEAAKVKAPGFFGKPTDDAIQKFVDAKLKPWVAARQGKIQPAVQRFEGIAKIQPVAPRGWAARGQAAAAKLWTAFADDAVAIADSPAMKQDEAQAANFKKQLEAMVASARETAGKHRQNCEKLAEGLTKSVCSE